MDETLYDVRTLDPTKQCKYASEKYFNSMKASYGRDIEFSFFFLILKEILKQTNHPIRHKRSKATNSSMTLTTLMLQKRIKHAKIFFFF
jgi:hypothetical protein